MFLLLFVEAFRHNWKFIFWGIFQLAWELDYWFPLETKIAVHLLQAKDLCHFYKGVITTAWWLLLKNKRKLQHFITHSLEALIDTRGSPQYYQAKVKSWSNFYKNWIRSQKEIIFLLLSFIYYQWFHVQSDYFLFFKMFVTLPSETKLSLTNQHLPLFLPEEISSSFTDLSKTNVSPCSSHFLNSKI